MFTIKTNSNTATLNPVDAYIQNQVDLRTEKNLSREYTHIHVQRKHTVINDLRTCIHSVVRVNLYMSRIFE